MSRRKFKAIALILSIFLLIAAAFIIYLNNIPIANVIKPLRNLEEIHSIYVEIDRGGDGSNESFQVEESSSIDYIVEHLLNTRLVYNGRYSKISYNAYEGDWIIVMHINGRDNKIYIKENGELYSAGSKYKAKGDDISELFHQILKNLPSADIPSS